jgi:hypothetical protein
MPMPPDTETLYPTSLWKELVSVVVSPTEVVFVYVTELLAPGSAGEFGYGLTGRHGWLCGVDNVSSSVFCGRPAVLVHFGRFRDKSDLTINPCLLKIRLCPKFQLIERFPDFFDFPVSAPLSTEPGEQRSNAYGSVGSVGVGHLFKLGWDLDRHR